MPRLARTVLVTGGCGFMGSHFVRHLYASYPSYTIVNLDLLTYAGHPWNVHDVEKRDIMNEQSARRYELVRGDVCDVALVDKLFKTYTFDLVVHFAAETHVDRSIFNVSDFIRTNVEGTRVLLEAVRRHGVPHLVHISTDEVYGNIPSGFVTEDAALNPSNPYAASKAAGDMLARTYRVVYGTPVSIVRSGNNYGTHQYPEKLIPLSITNMLAGKRVPVHGDGSHVRSWVHVDDFCHAVDLIAHSMRPATYNVAGEHRSNIDIIQSVAKCLGKDYLHCIEHVNDRPAADFRYAPLATKLERELGWRRTNSIEEAVRSVVEWYRTNEGWWQSIQAKKEFTDHYEKQAKGQWY